MYTHIHIHKYTERYVVRPISPEQTNLHTMASLLRNLSQVEALLGLPYRDLSILQHGGNHSGCPVVAASSCCGV